jgi:phosphomannomutase
MKNINKSIFREYDIRGITSIDLTDDALSLLGKAFATYFIENDRNTLIVGRDNRFSSDHIRDILLDEFTKAGLNVIDIGTVITPIFYFATKNLNIDAGIMITASHNPPEYNGFKVQLGESTIYGEEIRKILDIIEMESFRSKENTGKVENIEIFNAYYSHLHSILNMGNKKIKAVLDCGNGTASLFAPQIFESFSISTEKIYCESDPSFPNHFPDPVKEENLKDLINIIKSGEYDVGISLDGDGDRLGVVDEKGGIIWEDMIMILFSREVLKRHPGAKILFDVKCSQLLYEEINKLGGTPIMYKTGHSLMKAKMREIGAILAGEMSGHIFFKDEYFGYDDAVYAALRLMRILSNSDQSISEMLSDLPKVYSTPEIRVKTTESEKFKLVEKAKAYFASKYKILDIDGVRAQIEDGWGLIRASNTAPEIIVRCEARTEERLNFIKSEIEKSLPSLSIKWL